LAELDENFSRESENLYKLVKQASLETGNFGLVKCAMLEASSNPVTNLILDAFKAKLKKEAARINFDDVERPKGVLNKNHPLVVSLTKLNELREEYLKVKEFKKEAILGRNLSKLLKAIGQTGGYSLAVVKDIAKGLVTGAARHPAITGGVAAGVGGIAVGKKRGRAEAYKDRFLEQKK
jgi:hypothetical protein